MKGELYRVDEDVMNELRNYEGIGNPFTCYTEKVVKAKKTEHGDVTARAFVVIPSIALPMKFTSKNIPEGDWRVFKQSKRRLPIPQPLVLSLLMFAIGALIWQVGYIPF